MNIVHYMAAFRLKEGGVMRAVLDLCGVLAARGHGVTVMTLDRTDAPESWPRNSKGLPSVVLLHRKPGFLPRLGRASAERARGVLKQADVLHLHIPWDSLCIQLGRFARQSGVPCVVSLHGMLDDWCMAQKSFKKRLYLAVAGRRFLEQVQAVHCTAQAEVDQSWKWFRRGRAVIVPLVFDLSEYLDLPGPELARQTFPKGFTGQPVVLFIGRLHPVKGIDLLIETAGRLRDDGLSFKVLIAGTGAPQYEQFLRWLVEQQQLSEWVEFLGFVSGREKVSLFQAADVCVLPSRHENWGFVSLEALACTTPVVTTRDVNIWPELQASGAALIVDPTPQAIAGAVAAVLGDKARQETMQRAGRDWVQQNFAIGRVVGQYEQLYEGL